MKHLRPSSSRLAALAIAVGALLGGSDISYAQMSVSPIILEMAPEASVQTRTISVTNAGREPLAVRFYAGDFEQEENGDNRFAAAGTFPSSCGERLRVYPDGASILPGETQNVRVDMQPGAEPCWSAVFIETAGADVAGALVRQRIAAKVYGSRPDARAEGEVVHVATRMEEDGRKLSLTFRNLGQRSLRPQGTVEVRSFSGDVAAKIRIDAFSVLPGRDRTVVLPLPAPGGLGEYVAVPVLDFGGEYLAGGQAVFEVTAGDARAAAGAAPERQADGTLE